MSQTVEEFMTADHKEEKRRGIEELIASSQKLMAQLPNNGNASSAPATAFSLHAENTVADKRKVRKTTVEDYDEGSLEEQQQPAMGASTSAAAQRKAARSTASREFPTSPPNAEMLRDPTTENFSAHAYSWPILFALVPPMGALIYGKSDVWSDALLLFLIAFYLYNIIKVPWELYYAARARRILNDHPLAGQPADSNQDPRRQLAARELQRQELISLLFVIASPWLGGKALSFAKDYLTDYEKYISNFNINLFIFAAAIRPLMHIIGLAKARALYLHEQVHYPSTEVELLKRRVQHLEYEFSQLRRAFATKRDILQVRDGFEPTLSHLNKAVRRHERKEQDLARYSKERFAFLETKLREYDSFIAYRLQEEQAMTVPRNMMHVLFLPLNVTFTVLNYMKYFLPRMLLGLPKPMLDPPSSSTIEEMHLLDDGEPQQQQEICDLQKY